MAGWPGGEYPPPKPDDMPTDEYVESWFGGGLCGILKGLGILGLVAGLGYLISIF